MSYSRWLNSHWYAYWNSVISEKPIEGEQWLTFCATIDFTYTELKLSPAMCIERLRVAAPEATEVDCSEARQIFDAFIRDIEFSRQQGEPSLAI